jgi:hypothetical protein
MIMGPLIPVAINNEDQNRFTLSHTSIQYLNYSGEQDFECSTVANRIPSLNCLQPNMSENQSKPKYEYLDKGFTATIYRLPNTSKVCKSFWEGYRERHFPVEKSCYEIFTSRSPPPTILKYYGVDPIEPAGLILELAENGNLYKYLWDLRHVHKTPPSHALLYRWARQAASALVFVHSCGIWHCDIHIVNFLLDKNLDLKVADFAAASIGGGKPNSYYRHSHQLYLKGQELKEVSVKSEVFAAGSAVFQMVVGYEVRLIPSYS